MARNIAVIEFGTSKIVAITAKSDVFDLFSVTGFEYASYSGIKDGKILNVEELREKTGQLIGKLKQGTRIKEIYVGVPACFCEVRFFESTYKINGAIMARHMEKAVNAKRKDIEQSKKLLVAQPVYYKLDDNSFYLDPEGMITSTLTVGISYIVAAKEFLRIIYDIFNKQKISIAGVIPDFYAECISFIPPYQRDDISVLVNCGKNDTNISIICGDALLLNDNVHLGGADITRDLSSKFKIDMRTAEKLKRRFTFGIDYGGDNFEYVKDDKGNQLKFPCTVIQKIIEARVEQLTKIIYNRINTCILPVSKTNPILLCGGALSMMRGLKEHLNKMFDRKIELAKINGLPYKTLNYTTIIGLVKYIFENYM